jgi:hypothetical protein
MTRDSLCIVLLAAFVRSLRVAFVRDQVGGALSSAAVPRCGLGPLPPPLCRCAECTTDLILRVWWAFHRCTDVILPVWRVFHRQCRHSLSGIAGLTFARTHTAGCSGAWFGRRSGIKEELSALGRHGGQPRSRPSQASGRTNTVSPNQAHGRTNHRSSMQSFPSHAMLTAGQSMSVGTMHLSILNTQSQDS